MPKRSITYGVAAGSTVPALYLLYRMRVSGKENLPEDGFVLAAGHVSRFDPWPLAVPLWPRREIRFMAKAELYNPVLAPIFTRMRAFPVQREEADRNAFRRAVEYARAGEIVGMFPEGTRRAKGSRRQFDAQPHDGAVRIALRAGVPLVPAAISGTDRLLRFGTIRVVYGEPVPLDDLQGLDRRTLARAATDRLMATIAELEESLRPGPE